MNKTLLLIICDFLLISILALVDFRPEISDFNPEEELLSSSDADLVEVLRLSLESEDARNRELDAALNQTRTELEDRSERLSQTEQEREDLARQRAELEQNLTGTMQDLESTRERLNMTEAEREEAEALLRQQQRDAQRLQQELQERLAALDEAEAGLREYEAAQSEWRERERRLQTDLEVREAERSLLEQNLIAARAEVDMARLESERAQQRSELLAREVGGLAETSTALREEFRQAQPMSLNAIFRRFEQNRALVTFRSRTAGVLGGRERVDSAQTVIVEWGGQLFAVFEASRAGLGRDRMDRLQEFDARITLGNRTLQVTELSFLDADGNVAMVNVPREQVEQAGIEPFVLAQEPLRFPEAVLIHSANEEYGEFSMRVSPGREDYLSIEGRLFTRLLGNFAPTQGDLVFSKTGELIGIMVESGSARILSDLTPGPHLPVGSDFRREAAAEALRRLTR